MIQYKNISFSAKTFYGVRFEPGETKSVPGFINCSYMVRVFDTKTKKPAKAKPIEEPIPDVTRKRKKSNEPEKDSVAETETKVETPKEETSNGN